MMSILTTTSSAKYAPLDDKTVVSIGKGMQFSCNKARYEHKLLHKPNPLFGCVVGCEEIPSTPIPVTEKPVYGSR